jgi:hypothetical protein
MVRYGMAGSGTVRQDRARRAVVGQGFINLVQESNNVTKEEQYRRYIASAEWYAKREQRRAIDKSRCRTCGISERLECHHVSYERFMHEEMEDLITLCHWCHKAITSVIRDRRYKATEHLVQPIQGQGEINYVDTKNVSIKEQWWDVDAQRDVGRPTIRVHQSYEEIVGQAQQD